MSRQSETSRASGRDLISQTQEIWQEYREKIPQQQRHELGQVLTELGARISYTCHGQQPQTHSQYSTLGGSELASHAFKTVQKAATLLPPDASRQLTWVITEMANRIRYAAEGEPLSLPSGSNGESFEHRVERHQVGQQQTDPVFA